MAEQSSLETYTKLSYGASWSITRAYSTSFSLGIRLFSKELRPHIAAIYGMVRVADEIVDSWHDIDQKTELIAFENQCYEAIRLNYSSSLILHSFAQTANQFHIMADLIKPFFESMTMDLAKRSYDRADLDRYVYGSAEVVGLMCLMVFVAGNAYEFDRLKPGARALGSVFQKVNFLRDIGADTEDLGRAYFPNIDASNFSDTQKLVIVAEIRVEFELARVAIKTLPVSARRGVALAWTYYSELLRKIDTTPADELAKRRIRVSDGRKVWLLVRSFIPFWSII